MVQKERRGLLVGVLTSGLVLALFDAFVIKAAGAVASWPFWLPVLVPAALVLWLVVADWPRPTYRFIALVLGVDAFSLAMTVLQVVLADSTVWVFTESAAQMSLIFAAARWLPARTAWSLGAVTGVAASLLPLRFAAPAGVWGALAMCLIWSLGAVAAGVLGAYLRQQESRRQRDLDDVRRAQRLDLARDLHDFVAHHVSGIVVQAQASQFVAQQDPHQAVEALQRIEEAGQRALESMRRTVGMLRADDADRAPAAPTAGVTDLPELAERFSASGTVAVHLDVDDRVDDSLPPEVTTSAYRVVLEALTNVRRHASGATDVHVGVRRDDRGEALLVTVHDGAPQHARPDDRPRTGFGLLGLRERVTAIGGTFAAGPRDGLGWTVEARLPLPVKASRP